MKKTYFAPETKSVKITVSPLMDLSANLDSDRSITNSSEFGSRRGRSSWDDDDYDE